MGEQTCCMCGRTVSVLYGDYGICLRCVPPKQRLTAPAQPAAAEGQGQ